MLNTEYLHAFRNSIILALSASVISVLVCYFIAYGITMYDYNELRIKGFLERITVFMIIVPYEIVFLALYKEMTELKLNNTFTGAILPFICSPFIIIIFRCYLKKLPEDMLDVARIAGANEYIICLKYIMPMLKKVFVFAGVVSFIMFWNNTFWPLIILRSIDKLSVQVYLNIMMSTYGSNSFELIPYALLSCMPVILLISLHDSM